MSCAQNTTSSTRPTAKASSTSFKQMAAGNSSPSGCTCSPKLQAAPAEDSATAFDRYSAQTAAAPGKPLVAAKSLTDPSLTYVEMIDATRRMLTDSGQDVRKGLIKFQSALAREGYDGVSDVYPDRPGINVLPKEVTGRGIEAILKPGSPGKGLTACEAKPGKTDTGAAEQRRVQGYP